MDDQPCVYDNSNAYGETAYNATTCTIASTTSGGGSLAETGSSVLGYGTVTLGVAIIVAAVVMHVARIRKARVFVKSNSSK